MNDKKNFSTVRDIMSAKVATVHPDDFLVGAVEIILKNGYNGLPVVDKQGILVGILTQYDLMIRGTSIYLPTFLKLVQGFKIYQNDKSLIRGDLKKIASMRVMDIMNADPLTLGPDASIEEVVAAFGEHHRVNPIPVVDSERRVVGVVSRSDLIKLMGFSSLQLHADAENDRELDANVNKFLADFEKEFILVSKFRTKYWFLISLLFILVGILISFAFIIRVVYK